jgi:hypothetical protein
VSEVIQFPSSHGDALAHLARLSPLEYDRIRQSAAAVLGVRVGTLDAEVARLRNSRSNGHVRPAVSPNNEAGSALLDDVAAFIRRFVVMTDAQETVCSIWTLHTHAADAADYTPYLWVHSAEKQSGKTRLFEVLNLLVSNPERSDNISVAAFVHKIDRLAPTLLLDELDATFRGDKERAEILRGVLNSGFSRAGKYTRMVGDGVSMEPRDFSTFCPKALAGIGKLPDTIIDRSVPIRLIRRRKEETVERFRERRVSVEATPLSERLAGWASAHLDELRRTEPVLPEVLSDRQQDVIEPLLALATAAGGKWPERLRRAVVEIFGSREAEDQSLGVQLLADIRSVFEDKGVARISSADLTEALVKLEGRPWAEFGVGNYSGKPITPNRLARLLGRYEIGPANVRDGAVQYKGYQFEWFHDAIARYLPFKPSHPSQRSIYAGETHISEPSQADGGTDVKSEESPLFSQVGTAGTDTKPPAGQEGKDHTGQAPARVKGEI